MRREFFKSSFIAFLRLVSALVIAPGIKLGAALAITLGIALGITGGDVQARTVLDLDARDQPVSLSDWGDYVIEAESATTATQVTTDPSLKWAPTLMRGIYPLKPRQTLWVRFTVPPAPDAERWLVEIPYPAMDRAALYTENRAGQWSERAPVT